MTDIGATRLVGAPTLDRATVSTRRLTVSPRLALVALVAGLLVLPAHLSLVLALGVTILAAAGRNADGRRRWSTVPAPAVWFAVAALAFTASAIVSTAATHPSWAGLVQIGKFALIPLLAIGMGGAHDRRDLVVALWAGCCLGGISAGVIGVFDVVVLGADRAEGMTSNAIVFGDLSLLMGAIAVALAPAVRQSAADSGAGSRQQHLVLWWREITVAATVFGLVACVVASSRGAWISMPILVGWLAVEHRRALSMQLLRRVGPAGVALVAASAWLAGGMPVHRARVAVSEVRWYLQATSPLDPSAGTSIGARFEAWRAAVTAIGQHPFLGVGWGNLPRAFAEQAAAGVRNPRIAGFHHAHNQLISTWASSGLLGVCAWGALSAVPAWWFWRAWRSGSDIDRCVGLAGLIVVSGYLAFGATEAILENFVPILFYATVVASLMSQLGAAQAVSERGERAPELSGTPGDGDAVPVVGTGDGLVQGQNGVVTAAS